MTWTERIDAFRRHASERLRVDRGSLRVVAAPYRICPLGAHIDHQRGAVTAMAIASGIMLAYVVDRHPAVRLQSTDYAGIVDVELSRVSPARTGDWGNYVRGAILALQQKHLLRNGLNGIVSGSLPEGGLSSSAALGVACLLALEDANELSVSREENIRLDQFIENAYIGLKNGVLDQAAILLSRRDHLTCIDCASLRHDQWLRPANMPAFSLLIAFSGVRKALVQTDYNRRVDECNEAAGLLLKAAGRDVPQGVFGDVSRNEFDEFRDVLPANLARRAEHFFSESARVKEGISAWQAGDLSRFGRLITQSGESSIRNYECGSPPLVDLFHIVASATGVYGARFSGAGFRGCCLALVDSLQTETAADHVLREYGKLHPALAREASAWTGGTTDGAHLIPVPASSEAA